MHCACRGILYGYGNELGELAEVLNGCGEGKFVSSAGRAAQVQLAKLQNAFEMREQHLDFLSLAPRFCIAFRLGDVAGHITGALIYAARYLSRGRSRTAAWL